MEFLSIESTRQYSSERYFSLLEMLSKLYNFQDQAEKLRDVIRLYLKDYDKNQKKRREWVENNIPPEKRTTSFNK